MRLWRGHGLLFRAQGTCLVAANVVFHYWGANSSPQIAQLDLKGHFAAGERPKKDGKRGRKSGWKERKKGTKGTRENSPPRNACLYTELWTFYGFQLLTGRDRQTDRQTDECIMRYPQAQRQTFVIGASNVMDGIRATDSFRVWYKPVPDTGNHHIITLTVEQQASSVGKLTSK